MAFNILILLPLFVVLSVASFRLFLSGPDSLPNPWGLAWTRREARFLGWTVLVGVLFSGALWVAVGFLVVLIFFLPHIVTLLVLSLFFSGILARTALVLPATALDQPLGILGSWRLTKSHTWRLGLILLPGMVAAYLLGAVEIEGFFFLSSVHLLARTLVWLLQISALAVAYRWFTSD